MASNGPGKREDASEQQKSILGVTRPSTTNDQVRQFKSLQRGSLNGIHNPHDLSKTIKCSQKDCGRPIFKLNECKHHFCNQVKACLKREFKKIYRSSEKAYAAMDFTGKGFITSEDFMDSMVMKTFPFSKEDVQEFFKQQNLFTGSSYSSKSTKTGEAVPANGMNFDSFKKIFFPHLYLISDEQGSDEEKQIIQNKKDLKNNKDKQPEIIQERLKKFERILKDKFSNNWESVRKAFLALDGDYDGFITVEDILRYFGQEKELNYNDLKKLVMDKDSKKIGKIGYTDFSKWVGNSIHQSEGFYFRHDSIRNPQFDKNLERNIANKVDVSKQAVQDTLINKNLEQTILDKIQFQWKTLRKAFMDLNMEKSGAIMPQELRFYFKHWGLNLTDAQFQYIFDKFDLDKDGKISYKDFQVTVGSEIHPAEGLYFRQDKPQMMKINSCKHSKCWQATTGNAYFCQLHQKMHQDQCIAIFDKMQQKLSHKWKKFIETLKKLADPDDSNQIYLEEFFSVIKRFGINIKEEDKQNLIDALPGKDDGQRKRLNISKLFDQKYNKQLSQIYKKIDVHENDGDDDPVDAAGYLGQFYRQKGQLEPITETEFAQLFSNNNKLAEIMKTISEIDKQRNGYVTSAELDDILKIVYKRELAGKDVKPLLKRFASIQNRILIDYKKWRDSLIAQIKQINSKFTYKTTNDSNQSPEKVPTEDTQKDNWGEVALKFKDINQRSRSNGVTPIKARDTQQFVQREDQDTIVQINDFIRPRNKDVIKRNNKEYVGRQKQQKANLNQTFNAAGRGGWLGNQQLHSESPSSAYFQTKKMSTIKPRDDYSDKLISKDLSVDRLEQSKGGNLLQKLRHQRALKSQSIGQYRIKNHSMNASKLNLQNAQGLNQTVDYGSRNDQFDASRASGGRYFGSHKKSEQLAKANNQFLQTVYQTMNDSLPSQSQQNQRVKASLKSKLSYEWRNIYRLLTMKDVETKGKVSKEDFEQCCHQSGAFLSKEDAQKILNMYGAAGGLVNYQLVSVDLGMHSSAFKFIKSSQSRTQTVQRLRNINSSSEKKKPFTAQFDQTAALQTTKFSLPSQEPTKNEIKSTLLGKIKEFRDLMHMYQRKNNQEHSVLPLSEFKSLLQGIGINIPTNALSKFLVKYPGESPEKRPSKERPQTSINYGKSATGGLRSTGVDAREFLKFYI